ncbi:hypothetical protein PV04_00121 [Phialophora macrospora]|uniref:Uncharacterized protein n=1 Tax=Phialophora macrospora TaxID=1851006 RepID=A0A0D2FTV8_9EURO|nr:hypothetical protein PV04_00121 [Phialophora macrospora]
MSSSAAGLNPLPPYVHHSTTRLTHLQAHTLLASFLDRAENDAAYRPDSTLTERGPQALSSSSTPNLTLSHLKRILKGIEGERVGGGLKVLDETATADGSGELETSEMEQDKRGVKRSLALDQDVVPDESSRTPMSKKQKQIKNRSQDIIAMPDAEYEGDLIGGAVLSATRAAEDDNEWQDPAVYALGRHEVTYNDAAREEGQNVEGRYGGAGQNDAGGEDDLDFDQFEAQNEIDEARHPGARSKQPSGLEEESRQETGELIDPKVKAGKKGKKAKPGKDATHIDEMEPGDQKRNVDQRNKNKKTDKKGNPQDQEQEEGQDGDVGTGIAGRTTEKSSQVSKRAEDKEAVSQALSKEEKRKLKKLRHKDAKRNREEQRLKEKAES